MSGKKCRNGSGEKRQNQDYFSQHSILVTLPAYISPLQSVPRPVRVVLLALPFSASP